MCNMEVENKKIRNKLDKKQIIKIRVPLVVCCWQSVWAMHVSIQKKFTNRKHPKAEAKSSTPIDFLRFVEALDLRFTHVIRIIL